MWLGSTHLIAKVFCHPDPRRRLISAEREHNALQLLHASALAPCPRGLRRGPQPVVMYDYVPGSMWDRQPPTPFQLYQLAGAWLRLASVPTAGLWLAQGQEQSWSAIESLLRSRVQAYADWVVSADPQRAETATLCLHATDRMFSAIKPLADLPVVRQLGHWDPRFANVIQRPDGHITLVDWEVSGLLDPAREIACLLTHPNQEDLVTPEQWSAFLRPYLAARSQIDPMLSLRMELWCGGFSIFRLGHLLVDGVARYRTGRLDNWRVNDMPANLRLRRYLARGLAWPASDFAGSLTQLAGLTFFES